MPLPWAVGGDAESLAVDSDVVVVPTKHGEVVGVVGAAVAVFIPNTRSEATDRDMSSVDSTHSTIVLAPRR
ncbi:MAG: hypothetical protein O6705_08615 [Actinobacteria bacterium]|nr:hypothetical protein [Actinomycetota bacterium]